MPSGSGPSSCPAITSGRHEPDAARDLATVSNELRLALDELRELARGIHPAVLTNHGLRAALEALVARRRSAWTWRPRLEDPLPEHVEATVYYLVAESLTNVAKYARAGSATVSVTAADGQVPVEVRDDGAGGADIDGGSGLRGLDDRVEALRGTLRVESLLAAGRRSWPPSRSRSALTGRSRPVQEAA